MGKIREISRTLLFDKLESENLETMTVADIMALFRQEAVLKTYLPNAHYEVDPRDGTVILYNAARSRRPHDYAAVNPALPGNETCPICEGYITGVIDIASLSQGSTFINKNLYPVLFPHYTKNQTSLERATGDDWTSEKRTAFGLHFLQWTSTYHDHDWHNMGLSDRIIVLERLAALERKCLLESQGLMPESDTGTGKERTYGYVSVIKNYGTPVGGSLVHGHQQIAFSNMMPRRLKDNWRFLKRHRKPFSQHMLEVNPAKLCIQDYGPAVLLVPYFMRRPYDMMLIVKNVERQYLYDLTGDELSAIAKGWHDAIRLIHVIMARSGRPVAYNVIMSNGPGAGLYFEFLPYTQETGGFEQLGLWVCQEDQINVAQSLRKLLNE